MRIKNKLVGLFKSLKRIGIALAVVLGIPAAAYFVWSPGDSAVKLNLPNNAIWLGHGWLGDNSWFERNRRDVNAFRSESAICKLMKNLRDNRIKTVYPHLCPAQFQGDIAPYDDEQVGRFLDHAAQYGIAVIPWVGGVLGESARIDSVRWRKNFAASVEKLLTGHPSLAGIQVNIEPLPSGNRDFIRLLEELRPVLKGRVLSVAAYPPPTKWHPFPNVHWELNYLNEVSRHADQMAVMMYDTAIKMEKFYILLMKQWCRELAENVKCELLFGVPAYEDADSGYHHPSVENLSSAISGISAAKVKAHGIAIYCEWEMTPDKWQTWQNASGL